MLNDIDKMRLTDGYWNVIRHSGRSNGEWRLLESYAPDDAGQKLAAASYKKVRGDMRQGGLGLLTPLGVLFSYYEAPRVRTRW